ARRRKSRSEEQCCSGEESLGRKVWGGKFTLRGEFTQGRKVWGGKFTLRGEFARGRKVCSEAEN
ncbi:MAG TPA: hypothetical protein PKM32_02500, partial [Planctomycetota bacterium]|nr:hypothetical protein [Planctomycetota bacterium]